jgi:predicted restriction endonuclease
MGEKARRKRASLSPTHCEIPGCDWKHQIQRHRIEPGRNGGKYRKGNVISCCPNHHWLADNGIISPETLMEIVALRPAPTE